MKGQICPRPVALLSVVLTLIALSACTSKPSAKLERMQSSNQNAATADPAEHYFDGGTYCVQTFLQGPAPAQPLHFSNKITESDQTLKSRDFQGDLSGDTFDLVHHDRWLATEEDKHLFQETQGADSKIISREIRDGFAEETTTNHISRSDEVGWRGGAISITQGGTPWGLFIYKPTVTRVGPEAVAGFDTIKYAIDTTHESDLEKSAGFLRQLKDYNIRGTAWVLKDANCVLQYDITDEQTATSGKTSTTHYEGSVVKKESGNTTGSASKSAS